MLEKFLFIAFAGGAIAICALPASWVFTISGDQALRITGVGVMIFVLSFFGAGVLSIIRD